MMLESAGFAELYMNPINFIFKMLLFISCEQEYVQTHEGIDKRAQQLNDSAMTIALTMPGDSAIDQALILLDSSLTIQTYYRVPWKNKIALLFLNGKDSEAIANIQKLIMLYPDDADARVMAGILMQTRGDTDSAQWMFLWAQTLYKTRYPNLPAVSVPLLCGQANYMLCLKLLYQDEEANKLFAIAESKEPNSERKELIHRFTQLTGKELRNMMKKAK